MRVLATLAMLSLLYVNVQSGYSQVPERLPFEGQWAYNQITESGGNPHDYSFGFEFMDGVYLFYGMSMWEEGYYSSSADSIYITLTESSVPERTGMSFGTTWRFDDPLLILANASILTNDIYSNEEIALIEQRTGVDNNQSWSNIKLRFKE